MFFGLTNSPVTFQMMMNNILIIGSQTKEEHHAIVVWVLDILHRHRLYLNAKKCTFGQPMVEYLGLILSEGHIEMDPVKVASIRDWPTRGMSPRFNHSLGSSISTSDSSKTSHMCPSPSTSSPRQEKHGNGL